MREPLYPPGSANAPRLSTDTFFNDPQDRFCYRGPVEKAARFIQQSQLLRPELWRRFVQQFREDADSDAGWRGEFWGKMMRGACFTYACTRDAALYRRVRTNVLNLGTNLPTELGRRVGLGGYHLAQRIFHFN